MRRSFAQTELRPTPETGRYRLYGATSPLCAAAAVRRIPASIPGGASFRLRKATTTSESSMWTLCPPFAPKDGDVLVRANSPASAEEKRAFGETTGSSGHRHCELHRSSFLRLIVFRLITSKNSQHFYWDLSIDPNSTGAIPDVRISSKTSRSSLF